MGEQLIEGCFYTPQRRINTPGGDILHGMKKNESGFAGFGEAYFSFIDHGAIKAWKRHKKMTLNLLVPLGAIRFVAYDDRVDSPTNSNFFDVTLSSVDNYVRLTVPPMVWLGFSGVDPGDNLLLNVASHPHSDDEVDRCELSDITFSW